MKSLLLALTFLFSASSFAADAPRPNILYFYVDDLGWGSIGPNGQAERRAKGLPTVLTPNLDKLAAAGVNFTRAYGCTVCSPARSSQQTGFHQGHTFADRNDPDNAKKAIRKDDITMGDALSGADYVTGYWGKWGYGGSKDLQNPVIENVQTLPTSHGYRHVVCELHHVRAHTFFQPRLWHAPVRKGQPKGGLKLYLNSMARWVDDKKFPAQPANHRHPNYPTTAYCDDVYAAAAMDFVRAQAKDYRKTKQPFFGLLAVQIPHAPFDEIATLPDWDAAYADDPHFAKLAPQTQQWAAMVTRIDAHFGNILAALDDPNADGDTADSVADNTLVIFMSDNGGPGGPSHREIDSNGGLRGNKGTIYEGGIRVPTIMRWPGKIAPGTTNHNPIDVSDLLPTFCQLAGCDIPVGLDGVSLAPILTGEGERRKREFLIHESGKGQSIIRGNDKLIRTKKGFELYDLAADHGEENNLADQKKKLVRELEAIMLAERVDEPKGFANTYHHWRGEDGASLNDAKNWSDYVYENEGIAYLEDNGAPRLSWIATIGNIDKSDKSATAERDLEFLGLDVWGLGKTEIILGKNVNLTGRNEIRLRSNAVLTVDGGTVSSQRWIDVNKSSTIQGTGKIDATLFNEGSVTLAAGRGFEVGRDYVESAGSVLKILVEKNGIPQLVVAGKAQLAGQLEIDGREKIGDVITVISAKKIEGAFTNPDELVTASNGQIFKIGYTDKAVTLTPLRLDRS